MAGGPFHPYSAVPVTSGIVRHWFHIGAGSNSKHEEGLGVIASPVSNGIWRLRYAMPNPLPVGSPKLRLIALANATAGVARVNPKWASVPVGSDPSSATLVAEGATSLTWAAGDNDDYKELKIALDGATITADHIIVMDLTFETASWTLAQDSTWQAWIIFE